MENNLPSQSFAEKINLPAEVLKGAARVTVSGTSEVFIENHNGLSHLSEECVSVKTRYGECRVTGQGLYLAYMDKIKTVVRGFVVAVEFI